MKTRRGAVETGDGPEDRRQRIARRPAALFPGPTALGGLAALLVLLSLVAPAAAQGPLAELLDRSLGTDAETGSEATRDAGDPLLEIENALDAARRRLAALERARPTAEDATGEELPPALAMAGRMVRVLEQRRDAQIRARDLAAGRKAIETLLARDPSELFGVPPPFAVPVLDNVLRAWRREAEQEEKQRTVVQDRRANARLAREVVEDLDRERRRLREVSQRERDEIERIQLETELRALEDRLAIAREQARLAEQQVANATAELEIKQIATRQARAALKWVQAHLAPRETDLADAIERIDRTRLELDRQLDLARSRLLSAEAALQASEERRSRVAPDDTAELEAEIAARRRQLSHRQQIVSLLSQRIERLGRMRTTWKHRYAVLSDRLQLEEAPAWLDATDSELERYTRMRRIQEAELAELRIELASVLRDLTDRDPDVPWRSRWLEARLEDLETLVTQYQADLASLEEAIQLEERLRAELAARLEDRDLGERVQGLVASIRSIWSYELLASEDSPITPGKIVIGLVIFVFGLRFARFMDGQLSRRVLPRMGFDAGASAAFASLARYALLAAAFLFALRAVNIPLTAFAVVGGALALGIGFGSQAVVSNFISGLLLLAERPIRTGDLIEVGGAIGTVDSIGLRSTRVQTPDNRHIIVPNSSFLETNVVNWTHEDPNLRLQVGVGVAYGSPVRRVAELLVQAAGEHPKCMAHPAPVAVFLEFGDSALLFEVRFWVRYDTTTVLSIVQSDIRFRITELFAREGVTIAFPQMDVHLDGTLGVAAPSEPSPGSAARGDPEPERPSAED